MEGITQMLCGILDEYLNSFIALLAVFEFVLMIGVLGALLSNMHKIHKMNKQSKNNIKSKRIAKGRLSVSYDGEYQRDYNEYEHFIETYRNNLKGYDVFSLLIQLFPLLGILGTVAGLYLSINNNDDFYKGVGFALASTIYGIICAVIFKFFDTLIIAMIINPIEGEVEQYKESYDNARSDLVVDKMSQQNEDR